MDGVARFMISCTLLGSGDIPSAENTYLKFCLVVDTLVPVEGQSALLQAFECCFQGLVVLLLGLTKDQNIGPEV